MEDRIIHVHDTHHCCQFMYKDWQISLTTVPPQEVAVFKNVKDVHPFKTFKTVAEAIDWVNVTVNVTVNTEQQASLIRSEGCHKPSKRRYSAWHNTEPGYETQQEVESWIAAQSNPDEWRVVASEDAFVDRRDIEEAMLDEREEKVKRRIREAIEVERQRIIWNLIGDTR